MSKNKSLIYKLFLAVILPIILISSGVGLFVAMGSQQPKQVETDGKDPASLMAKLAIVGVQSVKPFEGIASLDVNVMGTVVPYRQVTLGAEIAGRIKFKSDECRIGRYVHKGDVLFKIDPTDFQLEVDRLAAMRDAEYAQQTELDQELSNAQKSLLLADEDYALQEKELTRLSSLPIGFASASEMDQARRLRITSASQRQSIQNQLQLLESKRTRILLGERLAAAQLEQAKVNLERTEVKSPISGVIIAESVQEDSFVQKGATLCMIEDTQRVEVSCNVRSDQLLLILDQTQTNESTPPSSRIVKSASYELPATPVTISYHVAGRDHTVYEWQGSLSRYEGIGLDAQSRTVPIRITVPKPEEVWQGGKRIEEDHNGGLPALVRGMFVDCSIRTNPNRPLVLLPKLALKPGNQVWQFEPDDSLVNSPAGETSIKESTKSGLAKPKLNVEEWSAGRVRILTDVRVISTIRLPEDPKQEYWITEANPDLKPETLTIVSPLANIIGDGTDKVRFQRSTKGDSQP